MSKPTPFHQLMDPRTPLHARKRLTRKWLRQTQHVKAIIARLPCPVNQLEAYIAKLKRAA